MRIVFAVKVLIITSMIVDSKKIRHLTTHKKVPRNRTSTTMTNIPVTKPTYGGIHPYEFEFPFPTTENLVRIYETLYDYPHAWNSEEFSDMMNPPANISAYENLKYPFTLDETVTYFNHLERNFKEEVLYALNNSFLKPIHLNMSEDMKYWRIINKVPDKYWPNKEHVYNLHIVSDKFRNWHHLKRHAMVHEALRDEMLKREAGCAIDIHADTPEEWNDFRANNDFDEISGKPDLRLRAAKTTPVSVKDVKLRDKIYNYIAKHFSPTVLHVVDSKKMHPIDNDNPAFDVLIVSNHFNNLTITQRTMLMHDYLRDFINEGVQFRLHLDPPNEYDPKNVDLYLADYTLEPTERDRSI
ncbi:uncharacterized protein LOC103514828 isoform X3 [Diaphorina citri]|uniref:Uncharacterized protein LOC103514828 isoform X3 n=1 Tax=Diaphorina citri TaxID=121845 RepID=A0A1S3DAR2_DIACI|nr:uncharacterized protein LOC103514828 isoform X3 [Diaphorina citri]